MPARRCLKLLSGRRSCRFDHYYHYYNLHTRCVSLPWPLFSGRRRQAALRVPCPALRVVHRCFRFVSPGGAAPDHGQVARVRRRAALQPDPAAAHVADARGPGAPSAGEGDRPDPLQARRPRPAVRPQDPRRHRAAAHRRGLLRARRGARDHLEPRQGQSRAFGAKRARVTRERSRVRETLNFPTIFVGRRLGCCVTGQSKGCESGRTVLVKRRLFGISPVKSVILFAIRARRILNRPFFIDSFSSRSKDSTFGKGRQKPCYWFFFSIP